ncbi:RNA polymerase sigma factor RpoE [Steroidobacter agaridevorans]|uniref:RNA polymerase sigma factor RpoE n=1 Tax=Steroidobacter agaridevorans TaxID=2695856 RepID=A0A829YF99_9GAMM|nr:RNA polymerase sigma factor [Steroidobacter agaridevorans]GFE81944.1 RNA polymerase sigma factor RpoE [Steroidobacter agaridevorans]GFE85666.1 RNA polymerase sigma factor RpoE [Steroidobacter agaridevorans]
MEVMVLQKRTRPSHANAAAEFDHLLREHVPALYRAAYRWTGAVDRAEDLVQELLVRLYPKLDELRGLDRIRPWALRVMYRIFVDQVRRERSSPVQFGSDPPDDSEEEAQELIDQSAGPAELLEQELTQDRVLVAWERLSEEHRVVLSMHDIEDYSLPELAQIMDVPLGTLKSRLHRARAKLKDLLATERISHLDRV